MAGRPLRRARLNALALHKPYGRLLSGSAVVRAVEQDAKITAEPYHTANVARASGPNSATVTLTNDDTGERRSVELHIEEVPASRRRGIGVRLGSYTGKEGAPGMAYVGHTAANGETISSKEERTAEEAAGSALFLAYDVFFPSAEGRTNPVNIRRAALAVEAAQRAGEIPPAIPYSPPRKSYFLQGATKAQLRLWLEGRGFVGDEVDRAIREGGYEDEFTIRKQERNSYDVYVPLIYRDQAGEDAYRYRNNPW